MKKGIKKKTVPTKTAKEKKVPAYEAGSESFEVVRDGVEHIFKALSDKIYMMRVESNFKPHSIKLFLSEQLSLVPLNEI
jgi:hypothetical protein